MVQRVLLVAIAAVVCAVLVAGLRSARLQADADRRIPAARIDHALVQHKRDQLDRARWLNPDVRPLTREAQLLLFIGRDREATELLEEVVRREPENAEAWRGLLQSTLRIDPDRSREAARRLRELSPPVDG